MLFSGKDKKNEKLHICTYCPQMPAYGGHEWKGAKAVMEWKQKLCCVTLILLLLIGAGVLWYRAQSGNPPHPDAVLAAEELQGGEGDGRCPLSED